MMSKTGNLENLDFNQNGPSNDIQKWQIQDFIAARETPPHVDKVLSKPPKLSELRATFVELTT